MKRVKKALIISGIFVTMLATTVFATGSTAVSTFDALRKPGVYHGTIIKGTSVDGGYNYIYDDSFTVRANGLDANSNYILLMVKASVDAKGNLSGDTPYSITSDNIIFVDQNISDVNGEISFNVFPSEVADSVLLLGGTFNTSGKQSPLALGVVYLGEVSGIDVSGELSYLGPTAPTANLKLGETPAISGSVGATTFNFSGILSGTYRLTIQKIGHLRHISDISVGDVDIDLGLVTLKGGDTNQDDYINASDLTSILTSFGSSGVTDNGCDINEDTYINAGDLSVVLSNFGQSAVK